MRIRSFLLVGLVAWPGVHFADDVGDPASTIRKPQPARLQHEPATYGGARQQFKSDLSGLVGKNYGQTSSSVPAARTTTSTRGSLSVMEKNVVYEGYSKEFQNLRNLAYQGRIGDIEPYYENYYRNIQNKAVAGSNQSQSDSPFDGFPGPAPKQTQGAPVEAADNDFLRLLERGTFSLDAGRFENAIERLERAEQHLNASQETPKAWEGLLKALNFVGETVTGHEELAPYQSTGYEKVLLLNFKSIAFLLQGDRRAYNVTRRAIDLQNQEKDAFEQKLREQSEEMTKQQEEESGKGHDLLGLKLDDVVGDTYRSTDTKALSVASAFVNPFGYYVAGLIQEFDSYLDPSLRDNARISYEKALDLNPNSKVIKEAVSNLKNKSPPRDKRLVHIVAANGFSPEKKVNVIRLRFDEVKTYIKVPRYEPVAGKVAAIYVTTANGAKLAQLQPVADVEAICLRHQKDLEPYQQFRLTLAVVRSVVSRTLLAKAFGSWGLIGGEVLDALATPDMRSWMSLPSSVLAARVFVPKTLNEIVLTSYDREGRKLASRAVKLNSSTHNFVYARGVENQLYAHTNDALWVSKL